MYKRYLIALPVLIVILFVITSCATLFRGILIPRVFFTFHQIDPPQPPSIGEILDEADKYPQTVRFIISQDGNSFKKYFMKSILVRAPYTQWHVREVRCEWENKCAVLVENAEFWMNPDEYESKDGWYCTNRVRGGRKNDFLINFEKVFKGKKAGDEFYVDFILQYSFDDEPELVQVIKYKVSTTKGESRLVIFS